MVVIMPGFNTMLRVACTVDEVDTVIYAWSAMHHSQVSRYLLVLALHGKFSITGAACGCGKILN